MDENWLQSHTGTETELRPGFEERLAELLSSEWRGVPYVQVEERAARSTWHRRRLGLVLAAAAVAAVATVAVEITRSGSTTKPAISPSDTIADLTVPVTVVVPNTVAVPATVVAPPATTIAPTSTATTTTTTSAPVSPDEVAGWLADERRAGHDGTYLQPGEATSARLLLAYNTGPAAPTFDGAVVLDDQHLIPLRLPASASPGFDTQLFAIGGRLALFVREEASRTLWIVDPTTGALTPGPELGLDAAADHTLFQAGLVGGSLLITSERWVNPGDGILVPGEHHGVLISPDLTLTRVAAPPQGVSMSWTVVSGPYAVLMGIDSVARANVGLAQPWAYDTTTNTWSIVPQPSWLACAKLTTGCEWQAPHETADPHVEIATAAGIVKLIPDGTVGLYDPATRQWRRLGDVPYTASGTQAVALNDHQIAVFPWTSLNSTTDQLGLIAILDLNTGQWTTTRLDLGEVAPTNRSWDLRTTDHEVLIATRDASFNGELAPRFAIDRTTGQTRPVTDTDRQLWTTLYTGYGTTTDIHAGQSPPK